MSVISFTVPGVPVGKARARVTKRGTFTPRLSRQYEADVKLCARIVMAHRQPMQCPIMMTVICCMPIPVSWSKKQKAQAVGGAIAHTCKPDASNVAKSIEDACNGIVYRDDAQIVDLRVFKKYGREPRVDVIVSEWK